MSSITELSLEKLGVYVYVDTSPNTGTVND